MIEFAVTDEKRKEIQAFETMMLERYSEAIFPYLSIFSKLGYELTLELGWVNQIHGTWARKRLSMVNGYECYVHCLVKKEGKVVQIQMNDGEADYYPLITSWMISSIYRKFHKLKISLYSSVDEVAIDLNGFISQLT